MRFLASFLLLASTTIAAPLGPSPDSAAVIALGHDSEAIPLQKFADQVQERLHRPVVTYQQFESAHYTSETGRWWDRLSYERTTGIVEQAIRRAVDRYPGRRVIAFNLDGYSPNELFGPDGREVESYTNFEVRLLLRDRRLFLATRWYRAGKELRPQEVDNFWAPVIGRVRPKECLGRALESIKAKQ